MTLLPPQSRLFAEGHVIAALLRASIVEHLGFADPATWPDLIDRVTTNHGGSLILPDTANSWASHMAELSLLGITGRGHDLESAVRDWLKAADRSLGEKDAA